MKTHFGIGFFLCISFLFLSIAFPQKIQIGKEILTVEMALTPEAQEQGLMGRVALPVGTGMLFVYEQPKILSFWMKNTLIPLSIGFFDAEKKLIQVFDMNPPKDPRLIPTYQSKSPALYALEVPQGWFESNQIRLGEKFSFLDCESTVK